jgi:antibiotic biosynthesis monooxygenase
MEHLRVATYEIKAGNFQEIAEKARDGMLKTFKEQPGFIRYGLADIGDKKALSISFWNSHKDADAATLVAATWVLENLKDSIELKSTDIGDLAFLEGVPAKV